MRLDKLTTKFHEALSDAQSLALGNDHAYIEPVHLLLNLGCKLLPSIISLCGLGGIEQTGRLLNITQQRRVFKFFSDCFDHIRRGRIFHQNGSP